MCENEGQIDKSGFAVRRAVRDLLRPFLVEGGFVPDAFERALIALGRHREIALRQIFGFYREGRVSDEMAALEVLGRLASPEDDDFLARVAADPDEPEGARVAAALVLLGHDAVHRIESQDVSRLVLRWQARFLAEEPSLRSPLMRLYRFAPLEERAAWAALQDRELGETEGRAAVFEMLLEVEDDPDLRRMLLDALVRVPHATVRASLRRLEGRTAQERDRITGALAALALDAEPDTVPEGWSARVGFSDGTGSFPLRIDFRREGQRPRSAVFVLNLDTGVRETLPLTGLEVDRYDRLSPRAEEDDEHDGDEDHDGSLMFSIPVALALGLLVNAERSDLREGRKPPLDYRHARALLDPLADVRPTIPDAPKLAADEPALPNSATLLDHAGYGGWFYDAGDHFLDDIRLEVLRTCKPGKSPGDELVTRAAHRLARGGEARRLVRMLRHNAIVHGAAGENAERVTALRAAQSVEEGGFAQVPLVRRMVRESLHPGHYFLTPIPDVPERHDLASLLLAVARPTKAHVVIVDLAWIFTRAMEVWLSRVPCHQRPHSDHVQNAVFAAARAAASSIGAWFARTTKPGAQLGDGFGPYAGELRTALRAALAEASFPVPAWDDKLEFQLDLLVQAAEALIFRVCLGSCPARCLLEPRKSATGCLLPGRFPAGREAEIYLRSWPGPLLHQPNQGQEAVLRAFVSGCESKSVRKAPDRGSETTFRCAICGEERQVSARARGRLVANEDPRDPEPVCRRCQRRYRRDADFRAEIKARFGRLLY